MTMPNWPFAFLRFGMIAMIYLKFAPDYELLYAQPFLYYGLPFFLLLATLGLHRYWMFALGSMLLAVALTGIAPQRFLTEPFQTISLGLVTFFLGFTPCDRDFSVRAWWSESEKNFFHFKVDPAATWNIYRLLVALLYFRFLLMRTNVGYFQGNFFSRHITERFLGWNFPYEPWFLTVCAFTAVVLWALNLSFTVLVWFPHYYRAFVIMALAFHGIYLATVSFQDMGHLLFILLLIPFAAFAQSLPRASKLLTSP